MASAISFSVVGLLGTLIAVFPDAWVNLFTSDAGVRLASRQYLATCAPMYAFLGLATVAYFSSQGAAKVIGPVLAQTARLVFVSVGGWWLLSIDASAMSFFWLAAASMILLGVLSSLSVLLTPWGPKGGPVPAVRAALS
jgi:Na+-driven multidrug efflux pump